MDIPILKRKTSKSSFIDDDDLSRMSDLDSDNNNLTSTTNSNTLTNASSSIYMNNPATSSRRMSFNSLPPSSPSNSYNKMSVDSDDAKSISSVTSYNSKKHDMETIPGTPPRIIRALGSNWITLSNTRQQLVQQDEILYMTDKKPTNNTTKYDLRERKDPERRNVNRRSSLLPKSKALLRVMDQADEETHLADLEMRREQETTMQLKNLNNELVEPEQGVPAASWTKVTDMDLYQCSKLNPEIEMTNFQLEHSSNKSIKRKASEDRLEPYPTSFGLKRRAVSPSVSLSGSPILSGYSSPPANFAHYGASSPNAAARAQQKPSSNNSFNLQEASGGLSRMSLSE